MAYQSSAIRNKIQTSVTKAIPPRPVEDTLSAALNRSQDSNAKVLEFTRASPSPHPACPTCGYDMTVITAAPAFLREGCEDISYACENCGTQMQGRVKLG